MWHTQPDKLLRYFINLYTHRGSTRGRTVLLLFYGYTETLWKHNDSRRIIEEFAIEKNFYIGLAAYPKWKAGTLFHRTKQNKKRCILIHWTVS